MTSKFDELFTQFKKSVMRKDVAGLVAANRELIAYGHSLERTSRVRTKSANTLVDKPSNRGTLNSSIQTKEND